MKSKTYKALMVEEETHRKFKLKLAKEVVRRQKEITMDEFLNLLMDYPLKEVK